MRNQGNTLRNNNYIALWEFANYVNHYMKLNFKIFPQENSNKNRTDSLLNTRY